MTPSLELWIANDTLKVLTKKSAGRMHMLSWDFEDIPPRTCKSFHIEFDEGWFIREKFDKGLVTFEHDSGLEFEIVADRFVDPKLTLTWRVVPNQITCFPPAAPGQNSCAMGWTTNGTRVILVQDKVIGRNGHGEIYQAIICCLSESAVLAKIVFFRDVLFSV